MPKDFFKPLVWALAMHGGLLGILILTWPLIAQNVFSFDRFRILRVSLINPLQPEPLSVPTPPKAKPLKSNHPKEDRPAAGAVPSPPEKPAPIEERPMPFGEVKADRADRPEAGMVFTIPHNPGAFAGGSLLGEKGGNRPETSVALALEGHGSSGSGKGSGQGTFGAAPRYGKNQPPFYPMRARENGWQGTTLLKVLILKAGNVGGIEIVRSSGFAILDQSALKGVKEWKFVAGQKDGQVIDMWVQIPITFRLEEER
jgi:TonB family protein